MSSCNGEVPGGLLRLSTPGGPMCGRDLYTEVSNNKKEPDIGRSRGDAIQKKQKMQIFPLKKANSDDF